MHTSPLHRAATAYLAWGFGKVAQQVEPGLVALHASRGYETPSSKVRMRLGARTRGSQA